MKKILFVLVTLAPTVALADGASLFRHVDAAKSAIRSAETLRDPYLRKARSLSDEMNRLDNNPPTGCSSDWQGESPSAACDSHNAAKKSNYDERARNSLILDRANAMVEVSTAAGLEAEVKLASAKISFSNPDSENIRKLRELQKHYFFSKDALKAYDDHHAKKDVISGFFSKLKDKFIDREREGLEGRIKSARVEYLDELRRQDGHVALDARDEELKVALPEVSERALRTADASECADSEKDGILDSTISAVKNAAGDFISDVRGRPHRSDSLRCGPETATASKKRGFFESAKPAPVEERSPTAGSAQ